MNKKIILAVCVIIIIVIIFMLIGKNKKIDEVQKNAYLVNQTASERDDEILEYNIYDEENTENVFHESDLVDNY